MCNAEQLPAHMSPLCEQHATVNLLPNVCISSIANLDLLQVWPDAVTHDLITSLFVNFQGITMYATMSMTMYVTACIYWVWQIAVYTCF